MLLINSEKKQNVASVELQSAPIQLHREKTKDEKEQQLCHFCDVGVHVAADDVGSPFAGLSRAQAQDPPCQRHPCSHRKDQRRVDQVLLS